MSDNLYSKVFSERQDIDLWQMSSAKRDQMLSETRKRKVDFNVDQRVIGSSISGISDTNVINRSSVEDLSKDIPESDMKITVFVLDSINALTNVLTHPLVVIRRQTQVSRKSGCYHLMPFSVMTFIVGIQSKQGFGVLWKGMASVFIIKAIQIGFESIISEFTPFVKDLSSKRITCLSVVQHLILKGVVIVVITPFLCSSCAETVQSSITSENPGVFDSIKEGFSRITHWKVDRKLPIWLLCGPTLTYHLSHYIVSNCVQKVCLYFRKDNINERENINKCNDKYKHFITSFWGQLFADVLLFPLQTMIMRLYLQGTRTIIDNVSQPNSVTPIISDYESTTDCFHTIVREEGRLGLFKGVGALVLQYSIHYSLLRLTKYCLKTTIPGLKDI